MVSFLTLGKGAGRMKKHGQAGQITVPPFRYARVYDDSAGKPATPADPALGRLLAEIDLSTATWAGNGVGGVQLTNTVTGTTQRMGTPRYVRFVSNDGATVTDTDYTLPINSVTPTAEIAESEAPDIGNLRYPGAWSASVPVAFGPGGLQYNGAMYGTVQYRPLSSRFYAHADNVVELPYLVPDTDWTTLSLSGRTVWDCADSAALTTAIAGAADGDIIKVHAGTRYTLNNVTLPKHDNWVYVLVASKVDGTFSLTPSVYHQQGTQTRGQRVGPEHSYHALGASSPLAQFVLDSTAGTTPIFCTQLGDGGYWWFEGIEFMQHESGTGNLAGGLVSLGLNSSNTFPTVFKDVPHHYNFGHCLFHGNGTVNCRRGIAANAGWVGTRDCSLYDFHANGFESAGIGGWSCPGPFSSINNFISAASQEILFGGSNPYVPGLVLRNMTTKWTWMWKNPAWFTANGGPGYTVKNHYEHKNGTHALIEDCVMEHLSSDGQNGPNVLFQVTEDAAISPPSYKITDITMRRIYTNGGGPLFNLVGATTNHAGLADTDFTEQPASRLLLKHILADYLGVLTESHGTFGLAQYMFEIACSIRDLYIENITGEAVSTLFLFIPTTEFDANAATRLHIKNNLFGHGFNGNFADGNGTYAHGNATIAGDVAGADIHHNVFYMLMGQAQEDTFANPQPNAYLADAAAVGFDGTYASFAARALGGGSAYKNAGDDGNDPGADVATILSVITAVKASTTLPT